MSDLAAARCPSCEAPRVPGGQYCHRCGTPLDAIRTKIAERRVVTVLFGDLSEFTAWAEDLDPERVGTVIDRVLAALTTSVNAVGGYVDKLTGDGIMAVFGAPVAHEDDALRAVRAAAAMQEAVRELVDDETGGGTRLGLRVGLNTGEVLAGVQAALSYTVVGDTVNTASRLSDVARVGAVVAGRETAQVTMADVSWRPLPPLRLKGKREDVTAYELVGVRATAGGFVAGVGDEAPFLGREAELGECLRAVTWSLDRGSPTSLLVVGEAGLGKKRLAHEVGRFVGELPGARILWGRCWPYGEGRDLGPLLEVVRTALGVDATRPALEQAAAVRRAVERLSAGGAAGHALVDDLLAMLGLAAARPAPHVGGMPGTYLTAVAELLSLLALDGPVLVVVDGVQWATEAMRELLAEASSLLRGPVVVMGLGRAELLTGFRDEVWERLPERHLIELQPLDLATADRLLLSHLGAELDAPARAALLDRAEGNPFFLAEVLHLLVDRGVLRRGEEGRWSLDGEIGEDVLPAGVQAVLAARVDELDATTKAVLRDAAVAGVHFDAEMLVAMRAPAGADTVGSAAAGSAAARDRRAVDGALDRLCAGGYVRVDSVRGGGGVGRRGFVFSHAMARDVAYAGVPKADRARRHAAVARWADGQREQAPADPGHGPQPDLDALVGWQGRRALELAVEMRLPAGDPVYQVRDLTVRALLRTARGADRKDPQALADLLSDALELAGDPSYGPPWDPAALARPRVSLGAALAALGRADEAEQLLIEQAQAQDPEVRAEATAALASLRRSQGRDSEAGRLGEQALDLAQRSGLRPLAAQLQRSLGLAAYLGGRLREAGDRFRAVLDDSRTSADPRGEAWALQQLAWTATTEGDYAGAEQWLMLASEAFASLEDTVGLSWCTGTEGLVRLLQGRYRQAIELAQGLLPLGDAIGDRWGTAACRVIVAYASAALGDTAAGRAAAQSARETFDELGDPWGRSLAGVALSVVEREDARPAAALTAAETGVVAAQSSGSALVLLLATTQVGTCLLDLDRAQEADQQALRALEIAQSAGLQPHASVAALVLRGQVAARPDPATGAPVDAQRSCGLLAEAERLSSDHPPMLLSRRAVLAWYARSLAACGRTTTARGYLEQALAGSGTDRRALVLVHVVASELARLDGDDAGALSAALAARDAAGPSTTPLTERELRPVLDLLRRVDTRHPGPLPARPVPYESD